MEFVFLMILLVVVVVAAGYGLAILYNRSQERREA